MSTMIQQAATATPAPMPAQEHLWRRDGVYYFRMLLPRELKRRDVFFEHEGRKFFHEIKFSLKTSNHSTAAGLVAIHTAFWRSRFDEKLREIQESILARQARELLFAAHRNGTAGNLLPQKSGTDVVLSDEFIQRIVIRHFIALQRESAQRLEKVREQPDTRSDVIHDIGIESTLTGDHDEAESRLRDELKSHLESYGIKDANESSPGFNEILRKYRAAKIEDAHRTLAELTGASQREFDPMFKNVTALTEMPNGEGELTIGKLISEFEKGQQDKRVSVKTLRTNAPVFLALREYFGEQLPVSKITTTKMVEFFDFLNTVPAHASKRHKGKTLKQAAKAVAGIANAELLQHRTKANYHARVVAMYEFGRKMGWLTFNPAQVPRLVDRFYVAKKSDRRPFTTAELSTIFHAPLYTGCKNDQRGWETAGPNVIRRGRFWVPLLALFQGFRCNEACQLEIDDVLPDHEGVPCISVTDEQRDKVGGKGKSVKNNNSRAKVPIHPMILRMGFLDFVKERKAAGDDSRLFPDLPRTKDGSYSDIFSKWFNRFLDKTFTETKAGGTFHSFRHAFRDAARLAMLNRDMADRLGRWGSDAGVGNLYGDGYPMSMLLAELSKIEYPGVNFDHLLVPT